MISCGGVRSGVYLEHMVMDGETGKMKEGKTLLMLEGLVVVLAGLKVA